MEFTERLTRSLFRVVPLGGGEVVKIRSAWGSFWMAPPDQLRASDQRLLAWPIPVWMAGTTRSSIASNWGRKERERLAPTRRSRRATMLFASRDRQLVNRFMGFLV